MRPRNRIIICPLITPVGWFLASGFMMTGGPSVLRRRTSRTLAYRPEQRKNIIPGRRALSGNGHWPVRKHIHFPPTIMAYLRARRLTPINIRLTFGREPTLAGLISTWLARRVGQLAGINSGSDRAAGQWLQRFDKNFTSTENLAASSMALASHLIRASCWVPLMLGAGRQHRVATLGLDDVTVETYPGIYDWQNLSSEGPIFDWMKARETGTNAAVNAINSVTTVNQVNGSYTNASVGDWSVDGGAVIGSNMRGWLRYTGLRSELIMPLSYRSYEGREQNYKWPERDFPLVISIDGEMLGRVNLTYTATANGYAHCFTPFIKAGNHTVDILWDGVDGSMKRPLLRIEAIRLQTLYSSSINTNGLMNWVAHRSGCAKSAAENYVARNLPARSHPPASKDADNT